MKFYFIIGLYKKKTIFQFTPHSTFYHVTTTSVKTGQ